MSEGYMALGHEAAHVDSFDLIFSVHYEYVYNLARALLRNPQDAEDIAQDVFIRVYKALPTYDPRQAGMRTWLAKMVVNACKTHRRRNFMRGFFHRPDDEGFDLEPVEPEDPSPWGAPETRALQAEVRQAVKEVLSKLRTEHRTVLVLHYYLDLSCPEIASIIDCPEGTVYSRLHYARRLVQAQLEGQMLRSTGEAEP